MSYLITGASSSIGLETIAKLQQSEPNSSFICTTRNRERFTWLLEAKSIPKANIEVCQCNVADSATLRYELLPLLEKAEVLDGIVNIAGLFISKPIQDTLDSDFDLIVNSNLRTIYNAIHVALPYVFKFQTPIVNIASVLGVRQIDGVYSSLYNAIKAAVIMFSRSLAKELGSHGVRVNSISPGTLDVDYTEKVDFDKQFMFNSFIEKQALKFLGKPEDIASAVVFLLNDNSKWITGENMIVDGGISL